MMLRRMVNGLVVWCALACLAASAAMASPYRGQVTFGGLPVPGTTVTATQGTKKVAVVTDPEGVYSFADLADGTWTIEIEMTGFAPVKQDVTIAPNLPSATIEMKLMSLDQIRAAAKPVKIEPAAAPVMSASTVAPAAAATPAKGAAKGAAAKPQPGGAPEAPPPPPAQDATAQQANDGLLINGSVNNAATSQYAMSQAFGNNRTGGRSLYNGGLGLILDNSVLDAKNYSISGLNSPKGSYDNITLTFNVGGPLKIPHLLPLARAPYFFIGYQRRQLGNNTTQAALVPTLSERAGDLSQLTGQTIYAPTTGLSAACLASGVVPGAAFTGNVIPAACLSGTAQNLLSFYPTPNVPNNALNNYQAVLANNTRQDGFQLQLNKGFGNKNYLNGRFNIQSTRTGATSLFGFHDATDSLGMNTTASWYHRFTQRFSNNATYTFSRSRTNGNPYFANLLNVETQAGIVGQDTDPLYWGPPSLSFSSGVYGLADGNSSNNRAQSQNISDNVEWNRGRHNVVVGGDFTRREWNYYQQSNPRGTLTFNGTQTQGTVGGVTGGGADLADFLLGLPDTSQIAFGNADKYLRQSTYDLYARDDFRVNPELSVNYGVRWEYGAPVTETKGRLVNLDTGTFFSQAAQVVANNMQSGQAYPSSLVRPDKSGIGPNVSIAWRPISGSSLLVKSSYAINHDTSVYQAAALAMAQQAPLSTSLSVPNSANCRFHMSSPFVQLPCSAVTPDTFAIDPNFRVGYVQTWTLSAQRDLPGSLQMVAIYTGIKGTRGVQEFLPNTYPAGATNPSPTAPSGYLYRTSNGNSTREAATLQLRRRLRAGFTANLSYTYAKAIDDDYSLGGQGPIAAGTISQGSALSTQGAQVAQDWLHPNAQRGLSTFDQRNSLTLQMQYTTGMGLGGGTLLSGWRGRVYKEWTFLINLSTASGLPETPIYPVTVEGTGTSSSARPNLTGAPLYLSTPGRHVNPAAYTTPALGQWGNARRDSITGPSQFTLNADMRRTFRLHDRYNLDADLSATNVLNHVTYTSWYNTLPLVDPTTGTYSTTVPSLFGTPAAANAMRSMQVTVRLRF
jgi:hypothetical protein